MKEIKPLIHYKINKILNKLPEKIFELLNVFWSPLHLIFPEIFIENVNYFKNIYSKYSLNWNIYFACKANKWKSFLSVASKCWIWVDVSSKYELQSALSEWIPWKNISISWPSKNNDFLLLAVRHGCNIIIDSINEIDFLRTIRKKNEKINILIRINDINFWVSRFWFTFKDIKSIYKKLYNDFDIIWLAFHLNWYSIEQRINLIGKIFIEFKSLRDYWYTCNILNIWWWFTINYFSKENWGIIKNYINKKNFYKKIEFSNYYPYYTDNPKDIFLEKILLSKIDWIHIYELINNYWINLHVEPWRALLDQAWITLFKVKWVKKANNNDNLVNVDGNFNHLSEQWFNTDFLPTPIFLKKTDLGSNIFKSSIAWNTCMENDILTYRKINFNWTPNHWDILIYVNTAWYQMDSNETSFHKIPIPNKLSVYNIKWYKFNYKLDEQFTELDLNY